MKKSRFDAFTWEYFSFSSHKFQEQYGMNTTIKKRRYKLSEKLTFKSGTGDAPDDWYVVYADKNKFT
jgi:hypothetical protein